MLLTALLPQLLATLLAASGEGEPSFAHDVQPLLAARCFVCHGPDEGKREARLRLDRPEDGGGARGGLAVVVPGRPGESELLRRVSLAPDDEERMPPAEHGAPLTAGERDVLRRWIEAGARWERHWAYAPFREVAPPAVRVAGWVRNEVDRFVLARLEREGLAPSPEADRRTLLRRVSLDLTGLPPTEAELAGFLADDVPGAYEREVDRLLASVHYAERQARRWLDLARYADSHGFTIDGARSMWPYRDWVVQALDADLPFDEFTVRQLAGDLLPAPTNADLVATGFHRNTQVNQEGGAKDEENRVNAVLDRVNTTGEVWLGTTLGCAQCHSHKYDPLTQTEYFQLYAFYDQTDDGGVTSGPAVLVAGPEEQAELDAYEAERARLAAGLRHAEAEAARGWRTFTPDVLRGENGPELVLDATGAIDSVGQSPEYTVTTLEGPAEGALAAVRLEALPSRGLPAHGPGRAGNGNFVLSRVRLFVAEGAAGWRELALARAEADFEQDTRARGGGRFPVADALSDAGESGWAILPHAGAPHVAHFHLAEPLPESADGPRRLRVELHQTHGGQHTLGRFRVRLGDAAAAEAGASVGEAWSQAWGAAVAHEARRPRLPSSLVLRQRELARTTHLFRRGNFQDPGPVVQPGFPVALDGFQEHADRAAPRTRLDLARWLVDPANALVWRVTANRWWQHVFGLGLVATENDLGLRGDAPTHPELLEWLAQELARDPSRKRFLRRLVTSATYRQSSAPRAELAALDPRNRLLARQSRPRLEGEVLRDAMLVASGLLSPEVGGPPVQPPQPPGVFAFTQAEKSWVASEGAERFRRSLYTRLWRSSPYPFYATFDAPAATVTCTRRLPSTTPLQALALANDPMVLELAAGLAERLRSGPGDDAARVARAFELCCARPPEAVEREVLLAHLAAVRASARDAGRADVEQHAWRSVARVLFNLDEFVTRP